MGKRVEEMHSSCESRRTCDARGMPVLVTNRVKKEDKISFQMTVESHSRLSRDITAAMLVFRTIAHKVFREFDSIIMQNLSNIQQLFFTPTWPSHHLSENQELHDCDCYA